MTPSPPDFHPILVLQPAQLEGLGVPSARTVRTVTGSQSVWGSSLLATSGSRLGVQRAGERARGQEGDFFQMVSPSLVRLY